MIKFFAVLCLLGAATALVEIDQLPNELKELIPGKLKGIYQQLSKDEKEAYHRVHEKLMWPDNVLEQMKTTDEMLYEKMAKFRSFFRDDIDQLTQRGRDFFEKLANAYADFSKGDRVQLDKAKQEMRYLLELYQDLDEWDVNVITTSFPSIHKAFESKQLKTFAGWEEQKAKEASSEEQEGKKKSESVQANVQ